MDKNKELRAGLVRFLLERQDGSVFRFSDAREALKVEPNSKRKQVLWAAWSHLRDAAIIKEMDTGQQRGKFYRVARGKEARRKLKNMAVILLGENADEGEGEDAEREDLRRLRDEAKRLLDQIEKMEDV